MKLFFFKYNILFLALLLFQNACYSQSEIKESLLNQNVKELMNSNPEQAINITKLLLSKPSITDAEKAKINFLTAKIYKVKGDYSNSLQFLFEEKKYANYLTDKEKLVVELEKIEVLRELSLDKEAKDILTTIENNDIGTSKDVRVFKKAAILLEKVKFLFNEQKFTDGITLLTNELQASDNLKDFPELALSYSLTLGQLNLENRNFIEAKKHFEDALTTIKKSKYNNNYAEVFALSGLASICFQEKKHNDAIQLLLNAYNNSIGLQNIYLQESVIKKLSVNYLAIKDTLNYKLTNVNFIKRHAEIDELEQESINTAYNLISQEQSEKYVQQESNYFNIGYVMIVLVLLFVFGLFFMWWRLFQKKKSLAEIIQYLNVTRNNFINLIPVKVEETKKINIPKETEQMLLKKLERFENTTKFTNKDISLAVLAGQFDTNTKYLSEVINSNFNMNFNAYINKLRINYIVEKLKSDPNFISYKISYLAEYCGFSSHSSFATVFKSVTGISPVTFIDLVRKEKEEENLVLENE